jgi:hypothetical protein
MYAVLAVLQPARQLAEHHWWTVWSVVCWACSLLAGIQVLQGLLSCVLSSPSWKCCWHSSAAVADHFIRAQPVAANAD